MIQSNFLLGLVLIFLVGCNTTQLSTTSDYPTEDIWYLTTSKDKARNVELFVKEIGKGDTIVVVHGGFGAEHSYLLDLFKGMENDFHLVFYDQRGSLRSPAPDSLITAMSHIEDLEILRQALNIKKLNLFGHSMGTWICSAYLNKYPENVGQMTLLGLVWPKLDMTEEEEKISNESDDAYGAFVSREEVKQEMEHQGLTKGNLNSKQQTYRWRIRFAGANIYDVTKWQQMKGGMVFYNQAAGTASGTTMPESYNWIETFKKNPQVPITVINGTHDLVDFGGLLHGKWLKPLPNLSYYLIENAGHNAWIDQPEEVRGLMMESLKP